MLELKVKKKNLKALIKVAADSIGLGKVIICPTDTVYGLVCDATNKKAVDKLFRIKQRPRTKHISVFVKDFKMAQKFSEVDEKTTKVLKKIWPGKVTIVLKRKKGIRLYGVGKTTIALRLVKYELINYLLHRIDKPLSATSANISGEKESGKIKEILNQFRDKKHKPDLVVDAGDLPKSLPSTIIDLTGPKIKILRQGAVKLKL